MNQAIEGQSTGELIKIIKDDAAKLVSQHIELAKVETAKFVDDHMEAMKLELMTAKQEVIEKASHLARNTAYLSIGGLVFYTGFVFILIAATLGLNDIFMDNTLVTYSWSGPLIVGAVTAIVGFMMVVKAKKAFEEEKVVPQLSSQNLKEKQKWMSNQIPSRA